MKNFNLKTSSISLAMILFGAGCGSSSGVAPNNGVSHGVTQGGAQDFARFRQIVDGGQIPASRTLDEVGFFADAALHVPPAHCGSLIRVAPMHAVRPGLKQ